MTGEHARRLWETHVSYLSQNGLLTEATVTSFVELCEVYEELQQAKKGSDYKRQISFVKLFTQLSKPFRLQPSDLPSELNPDDRHGKKEFEFEEDI